MQKRPSLEGGAGMSLKERMAALASRVGETTKGISRDLSNKGLGLKDRMAALADSGWKGNGAKVNDAEQRMGAAATPPPEAHGSEVHAAWIKRSGAGILSASFFTRFCVLFSDPGVPRASVRAARLGRQMGCRRGHDATPMPGAPLRLTPALPLPRAEY